MKGLAMLVLVLHASDAERTPGEVARFGFPYQSCKAGEFEDGQSGSRKLELGTGGGCAEGPFGNHLGVVLNASLSGVGAYEPLESAQGDFAAELTGGFTLELWVKPHKLPQGDTADRVIVSLSAREAKSFTHAQMQALNCTQDEVSFQLIMKPSGCLVVHTKLISTEDCLAPRYEQASEATGLEDPKYLHAAARNQCNTQITHRILLTRAWIWPLPSCSTSWSRCPRTWVATQARDQAVEGSPTPGDSQFGSTRC